MNKIAKEAKTALWTITILWSVIMLIISYIFLNQIQISTHFNFEIVLEFSKAVQLWYIIALLCIYGVDKIYKNKM